MTAPIILGSQSPRRLELLSLIAPVESIVRCPPLNSEEAGFERLSTEQEILHQLKQITYEKNRDVSQQQSGNQYQCVLTADTIVVAEQGNDLVVLGKPDGDDWESRTKSWFKNYYCGRTHQVVTAVCLSTPSGKHQDFTVSTDVTFLAYDDELMDWYLSTAESLGKAGAYAIQGAGSLFVTEVNGSISNVIGLPLAETRRELLQICG